MAETASATAPSADAEDATRGRPYYEKLRADLKATLEKKRELDKTMAAVEESIARAENAYLEETQAAGNIIKGFDNYIKASASGATTAAGGGGGGGGGTSTRRKGGITDADRIFSRSSASWVNRDNPNPTLSLNLSNTPSERVTPVGAGSARNTPVAASAGNKGPLGTRNKKKGAAAATADKDKDKDDGEDSERPTKRGKVSWTRE